MDHCMCFAFFHIVTCSLIFLLYKSFVKRQALFVWRSIRVYAVDILDKTEQEKQANK